MDWLLEDIERAKTFQNRLIFWAIIASKTNSKKADQYWRDLYIVYSLRRALEFHVLTDALTDTIANNILIRLREYILREDIAEVSFIPTAGMANFDCLDADGDPTTGTGGSGDTGDGGTGTGDTGVTYPPATTVPVPYDIAARFIDHICVEIDEDSLTTTSTTTELPSTTIEELTTWVAQFVEHVCVELDNTISSTTTAAPIVCDVDIEVKSLNIPILTTTTTTSTTTACTRPEGLTEYGFLHAIQLPPESAKISHATSYDLACTRWNEAKDVGTFTSLSAYRAFVDTLAIGETAYYGADTDCDLIPDGFAWVAMGVSPAFTEYTSGSSVQIVEVLNGVIVDIQSCYYGYPSTTEAPTTTVEPTTTNTYPVPTFTDTGSSAYSSYCGYYTYPYTRNNLVQLWSLMTQIDFDESEGAHDDVEYILITNLIGADELWWNGSQVNINDQIPASNGDFTPDTGLDLRVLAEPTTGDRDLYVYFKVKYASNPNISNETYVVMSANECVVP